MGASAAVAVLANTVYGAATGQPGGLIGQVFGVDKPSAGGGAKAPSGKSLSSSDISDIVNGKTSFRGNASDLGVDTDTYNFLAYKAYGSWTPNGDGTFTNSKTGAVSSSPDAGTYRTYSGEEDADWTNRLVGKPVVPAALPSPAATLDALPAVTSTTLGDLSEVSLTNPPKVSTPAVMPTMTDANVRAAKRESLLAQQRRQGRASTILTGDKLGS